MSAPAINRKVRVGGSGYTAITINGSPIAYAQQVSHTPPRPIAQPVGIQPLDAARPVEIVAPIAVGMGTLVLNVFDLFEEPVWDHVLKNHPGYNNIKNSISDLADLLGWFASSSQELNVAQRIRRPGTNNTLRKIDFINCVIVDVADTEEIQVGTLEVIKQVTMVYRKKLTDGRSNYVPDSQYSV